MEAKLKSSSELLTLRVDPDHESHTIYTTRTMLAAEKSLIETAEKLGEVKSHGVEDFHREKAIERANEKLKDHGGLSSDQIKVIHHLVEEGQIKCVVGIAGAGKTTALGVCHEVWKAEGYAVYGLTPTGKATQNLEQSGISSMTLHKFLKSFEEGRCQYNEKSILVLDEAGMVDVERFEKLLNAVQHLKVKLVVVGDGAQLQPVEAGPAFRLVTERLGKSELSTVVRQKEEWQREATFLFGQQKTAEALQKYGEKGCVHIVEEAPVSKTQKGFDSRDKTKDALIQAWQAEFKGSPGKSTLLFAHSNRDVKDLNQRARLALKDSGHISKQDFSYTIKREVEDDFGRKHIFQEKKPFSQGDRIVFTRNNNGLGVKNGTMGMIIDLNKQKIHVTLDEGKDRPGKEISFSPNLNPYFDQGWAVTVHKSQGTTVDKAFVLASYSMTQNLAYVAMTRHREGVHLFGSSIEFSHPEHLSQALSKSGEKLSAGDYLDTDSITKLMKQDDHHITKLFNRMSNELEAMGAVTKKAFWTVADHFLGVQRKKDIRVSSESLLKPGLGEEKRAERILKPTPLRAPNSHPILHPTRPHNSKPFFEAHIVEEALKQNMAAFAEDVFSSMGVSVHQASSSSTQRRYGKKGHISVNLKTGAWIDFKDSEATGGPLHLLTKLKGLSFKEAIDYGASWAGLMPETIKYAFPAPQRSRETLKEDLSKENKAKIAKAQALWNKGLPIEGTLAEQYLREHRKIEGELSNDLRYIPSFYDRTTQSKHPCLMAAARNQEEQITAVQLTFLNPETGQKVSLDVAKKSFGVIKGSVVTLQENTSGPLVIAEGVETALSLKSAGVNGTIQASLGLSNIQHISPRDSKTPIIICADHDALDSPAAKSLEKSIVTLQEKGLQVTVVKPDMLGEDFNDILKKEGVQKIREILQEKVPQVLRQEQVQRQEGRDVFNALTQSCEKYLYEHIRQENIFLSPEKRDRIPLQAERAANFIFYTHTVKGTEPTDKETRLYLLRAKYELDRIPQIKETLTNQWQQEERFDKNNDPLIIQMIADRQASIEGRLYIGAKREGITPSPLIPDRAKSEFKEHREQTKSLARTFSQGHSLSERAATHCVKDILRYQETHGDKPTQSQVSAMVEISRELDKSFDTPATKSIGSHNMDYMRRMEGDSMLRGKCYEDRHTIQRERQVVKLEMETQLESQQQQELLKQKDRGVGMEI